MRRFRVAAGYVCAAAVLAAAPPAAAQPAAGDKWLIEIHGGGLWPSGPTGGDAAAFPAATTFTTLAGSQSRRVSSWFFGDGATLLNSVNGVLAPSALLTPLDKVLGASAATHDSGPDVGLRVARRFGSRYSAELSVDYARTPLKFTQKALDGIDASRASFASAFAGLFRSGPSQTPNASATADIKNGSGHELLTTGVLTADLITHGRFIPFVLGGAGVASSRGPKPSASLVGNYSLSIFGIIPINETDRVTLRVADRARSAVGVFGGGFRYAASPRWGVRVDARATVGGGKTNVFVDASPSVAPGSPAILLISPTNPSAVFSTTPISPSSLSGPAISGLRTFTTSGTSIRTNIVAGVYLRF